MDRSFEFVARVARVTVLITWGLLVFVAIASFFVYPEQFTASNIAEFAREQSAVWLVYFTLSVLRGFTLLPSTPLVLAGTLLYPDQPFLVLSTSLAGIIISSAMIYYFSELLGFSEYFERKRAAAVQKVRRRLESRAGFVFVALWAFFPFVPTDAVCYVAGTIKMNFLKFITAVFLGELALCIFYVYSGTYLIRNWL